MTAREDNPYTGSLPQWHRMCDEIDVLRNTVADLTGPQVSEWLHQIARAKTARSTYRKRPK